MVKRNPYLNRSMIRSVHGFFGRWRERERVMARIGAGTPQSVSIVGDRRVGKSSLLWHLAQEEVRARHLDDPERYLFVYIDFQGQRHLDLEGFSRVFSRQLAEAAAGKAAVTEAADLGALESVFQGLRESGLRVVGLFDEFDTVTGSPAFGPEFFGFLRSLANAYPVAFVTASRRELQALCSSQEISESPFFNIFSCVALGPLEAEPVSRLISGPSAQAGVPLDPYADRLVALGGHLPLFVQMACSAAFECLQERGRFEPESILQRFREEADGHLLYLWAHLDEDDRETLRSLLAGSTTAGDLSRLERRGYVVIEDGTARPFCRCLGAVLAQDGQLEDAPVEPARPTVASPPSPPTGADSESRILRLDPVPAGHLRFRGIVGRSLEVRRTFAFIERAAGSDVTVLLLGDTGTGKELVARTIHEHSRRRDRPFVVVNCGAIAENLQESELFGHRRGAFTDAVADRQGLFEAAHGGTLLLDEIAETTQSTQVKLLRVLQEREVRRVGETHARPVDVRVIAATNRDLVAEVAAGRFREDLYYRLLVLAARLPALRDRVEDIDLLVDHFLAGRPITRSARDLLRAYEWPGNVRELENQLAAAVAVAREEPIRPEHLWPGLQRLEAAAAPGVGVGCLPSGSHELTLRDAREAFERDLLACRLERHGWEHAGTADSLGISRSRLYELIRKYGIARDGESA